MKFRTEYRIIVQVNYDTKRDEWYCQVKMDEGPVRITYDGFATPNAAFQVAYQLLHEECGITPPVDGQREKIIAFLKRWRTSCQQTILDAPENSARFAIRRAHVINDFIADFERFTGIKID
jgi:hypothetical protein